jgi:hypothetical protein
MTGKWCQQLYSLFFSLLDNSSEYVGVDRIRGHLCELLFYLAYPLGTMLMSTDLQCGWIVIMQARNKVSTE